MASIIAGLADGLVATIVMTILMMVMGDDGPPPTAALVAKSQMVSPKTMQGQAWYYT